MFFSLNDEEDFAESVELDIDSLNIQRIVFVGGRPTLQNKLNGLFKGWKFISSDSFDLLLIKNAETIIIHPDNCSHSLYYKIINNSERSAIHYVSKNNIEKLLQEILNVLQS